MKRFTVVLLTLAMGLAGLSLGCKGKEGTTGGTGGTTRPAGQPTTAPAK